jgi:alpha-tubulin suppressor-like RCC1 family protein
MGGWRGLVLVAIGVTVAACSVLDDSLVLPRCARDADCVGYMPDDPCVMARCEAERCVPDVVDADGDGFGEASCVMTFCTEAIGRCASADCDDAESGVHPGAEEICNGIDDDCNGLLDGFHEDDDRDGHAGSCAGPRASDCDDANPEVFVGAIERCDPEHLDNDCIVGGFLRTTGSNVREPSEDADGDGHVAPDDGCQTLLDTDLPKDDCDDANPRVYPGATEICDGFDNDCNAIPDDYRRGELGSSCVPERISAGDAHSCVTMVDQSVVCWGVADFRLAAISPSPTEAAIAATARVPGAHRFLDIAAGQDGSCGVIDTSEVRCWGSRALVSPGPPAIGEFVGSVPGVTGASRVVAGEDHACALAGEGGATAVWCWGRNLNGAVNGVAGPTPALVPAPMPGTEGATALDSSFTHTCAVVGGRVVCWGDATSGALGGTPSSGEVTVTVPSITDATEVAVGRCFTCVRHGGGNVSCFGDARYEDDADLSGPCTAAYSPEPRPVAGITDAVAIDAYVVHACAARGSGEVACWGNNTRRQLGDGTPLDLTSGREGFDRPESDPVRVIGVDDATRVAVGTWHSCALGPSGAYCWGRQVSHRLGNGRFELDLDDSPVPVARPVSVIRGPLDIAANDRATCFRMPDLSLRCAGRVPGEVDARCYAEPIEETTWQNVLAVDMHEDALCAVTASLTPPRPEGSGLVDRVLRCRGSSTFHPFLRAVGAEGVVPLPTEPVAISVGLLHACVVDTEGAVLCWGGETTGQLGGDALALDSCRLRVGSIPCSLTPTAVELPRPASAVVSGGEHTCALLDDGSVACWGSNELGQLGRTPRTSTDGVGLVQGLPGGDPVVSIAAGGRTTCAILASRSAWCWGESVTSLASGAAPQPMVQLAAVEEIAILEDVETLRLSRRTGGLCARLTTGPIFCLGQNENGRLGGEAPVCDTPVCPVFSEPVVSVFDDAVNLACGRSHCCATRLSGQVVCWGERTGGRRADGLDGDGAYQTASTVDLVAHDASSPPPACAPTPVP